MQDKWPYVTKVLHSTQVPFKLNRLRSNHSVSFDYILVRIAKLKQINIYQISNCLKMVELQIYNIVEELQEHQITCLMIGPIHFFLV